MLMDRLLPDREPLQQPVVQWIRFSRKDFMLIFALNREILLCVFLYY